MSATLMTFPVVRWTITGISDGQPLAGTSMRAAQAYQSMTSAEWRTSPAAASIPAHHYDAAAPANGDAYKQTWGYDEASRTERSACGAVCYTVAIPYDALTGADCMIEEVSATLYGDRYLADGAILTVLVSPLATPPPFDELVSSGTSSQALLIPATTDADDQQLPPNKRPDTTAAATVAMPTSTAATRYLHILLRCADYLSVRGAWHEGGAMLDAATIAITFSRVVAPDASAYALEYDGPYYLAPGTSGAAPISRDGSAVFAIQVPNLCVSGLGSLNAQADAWAATGRQLTLLLEGLNVETVLESHNSSGQNAPSGHALLSYDASSSWDNAGAHTPDSADGSMWCGYKLNSFRMYANSDDTYVAPRQVAPCVVYPLLGARGTSFTRLVAPAFAVAEPLAVRLLAYRLSRRPPLATTQAADSDAVGAKAPVFFMAYADPLKIPYANLFRGVASALPWPDNSDLGFTSFVWKTFYPRTGGDDGTGLPPTTDIPCECVGAWNLPPVVAAGQNFVLEKPIAVEDYAALMLVAVPTSYTAGGGRPGAADDCFADIPFKGWSLI